MTRPKIVAANWKMNLNLMDALTHAARIMSLTKKIKPEAKIILAPPAVYLHTINSMAKDLPFLSIAAQNCNQNTNGAFTGEISAEMLASMNIEYVIIGHSERRAYHDENDELLLQKVKMALDQGMKIIFCIGESEEIRKEGHHKQFVLQQLEHTVFKLKAEQFRNILIAYEPVWAIGTGKTASDEQAQEMHAFIRSSIENQFGSTVSMACPLLYGGSCNAKNAKGLFAQQDIDGGLIGGASLDVDQFMQIISAF